MGTYEDAGIFLGPDSTDHTAELRRVKYEAGVHKMLAEAMAKPKPNPLAVVGDAVVQQESGGTAEAVVADIVRTLDAIHEAGGAA